MNLRKSMATYHIHTMSSCRRIFVTGGAGFIGSAFVKKALLAGHKIFIFDLLVDSNSKKNYQQLGSQVDFYQGDIRDSKKVNEFLNSFQPDQIVNFAAETHVDTSIENPNIFIQANIIGVFELLEATRRYLNHKPQDFLQNFRFLQISTDEVFGALGSAGSFTEDSSYQPSSPYSATKAAADHLVRAWFKTYNVPILVAHGTNNFGPGQAFDKLIPKTIKSFFDLKQIHIYGKGEQVRDWLFVDDYAAGLLKLLESGRVGESYCFAGQTEKKNIEVVKLICNLMQQIRPQDQGYENLICFVQDRPGHDWRYSLDDKKSKIELNFERAPVSFEQRLLQTVKWYVDQLENVN